MNAGSSLRRGLRSATVAAALSLFAILGGSAAACTGGPATDAADGPSGGAEADKCCPPASGPACCMDYGGSRKNGACARVCDGMPTPDDPGWKLGTDSEGCPVWTNPNDHFRGGTSNPDSSYCGGPPKRDASAGED